MTIDILLIFLISFTLNILLRFIKIPNFCGFLVTGFIAQKLDLLGHFHLDFLSKIGILLLLFSVGLELSAKNIQSMKKFVIPSIFTMLTIFGFAFSVLFLFFSVEAAFFIGCLLSFNSTAIVVLFLKNSKKINTEFGQLAVTGLVLQDLVSIMLILILQKTSFIKFGIATSLFGVIFFFCSYFIEFFVEKLYNFDKDSFFLFLILFLLGFSCFSEYFHLSAEIGAMCAGIVLANSKFTIKIEATIHSLKELFLMFFFMETGSHIKTSILFKYYWFVIIGVFLFFLIKTIAIYLTNRQSLGDRHSLVLSFISLNASETVFLILALMVKNSILNKLEHEVIVLVFLFSLFLSPIFLIIAQKIQRKINKNKVDSSILIIEGGIYAESIAKFLQKSNFSPMIVDSDINNVINTKSKGFRAILGDFFLVYKKLHIENAKVLIFTNDEYLQKIIEIKELYDHLEVIVLCPNSNPRTEKMLESRQIHYFQIPSNDLIEKIGNCTINSFVADRVCE